jgi:hypothetical protein
MAKYDTDKIIKRYVYGTETPSTEDYNLHIRPWNESNGAF